MSSIFALFSTILNFAVRDKKIPANPCSGVSATTAAAAVQLPTAVLAAGLGRRQARPSGVPEVTRRARLGQKMKGITQTYDHVTPVMKAQIVEALEARWRAPPDALTSAERRQLGEWFPHLTPALDAATDAQAKKIFAT